MINGQVRAHRMLSGLEGKVAVVTGAAGGLGAASALRLSREGCRVVVVDLDGDGARKVAESLPGTSIAVTADVSVEEDVERYLDEATHSFGRIDFHHLNAGIPGSAGGFPDLTADGVRPGHGGERAQRLPRAARGVPRVPGRAGPRAAS